MTEDAGTVPPWNAMTEEQTGRWTELLDGVAGLLPAGAACVRIDGAPHAAVVADRLADRLRSTGRRCTHLTGDVPAGRTARTVTLADGSGADRPPDGWDAVIRLRTERGGGHDAEHGADIVIDLHDPVWPVIRHVTRRLAGRSKWYIAESRAFFGPRAATWDTKFGDDMPAYAAAVAETATPAGATVVDVGCGTGRALPALRTAVGPAGHVIGVDITPQMLSVAADSGRARDVVLMLADARRLPFTDGAVDAVFAAGLVPHLPDPAAGLAGLARITRPGGRLALFHPTGRAALAARHNRVLAPDDPLAEARLGPLLAEAGWSLDGYDDAPHRFLALATRSRSA
ncbi:methyltransferase domain-containing protein [Actinomadura sp. DC4]|uniref:class I SAM-dependent methyltransferase n=1 Tax=Actinomadura sp. DC4 TaxID=3055069 RepID=UPI0025AF8AB5|nr:methyltransferase domain-containing protein [Actinomadura sp. DC4]MDN3359172.1 methyltransferase domain-containing protein [Actinomadura sp. DC4]